MINIFTLRTEIMMELYKRAQHPFSKHICRWMRQIAPSCSSSTYFIWRISCCIFCHVVVLSFKLFFLHPLTRLSFKDAEDKDFFFLSLRFMIYQSRIESVNLAQLKSVFPSSLWSMAQNSFAGHMIKLWVSLGVRASSTPFDASHIFSAVVVRKPFLFPITQSETQRRWATVAFRICSCHIIRFGYILWLLSNVAHFNNYFDTDRPGGDLMIGRRMDLF